MVEAEGRDGQDAEAVRADEERILVRAVLRAAVLHDPQMPRGDLIVDPMIEQENAVGDVLLQSVARQGLGAALSRDDRRHALDLQPAEEAAELGAQDRLVAQPGEQRLERIEHDAPGADGVDGMVQPDEEAFEIVLAGFLDLPALDHDVIEKDLPATDQVLKVESERRDVGLDLLFRLLERHKNARLSELPRAVNEELGGEESLAAAGATADERR